MKVKELKKYLEDMNDDGVVEISLPVEGESTWWDCELVEFALPDGIVRKDRRLLHIKPTEIVMR